MTHDDDDRPGMGRKDAAFSVPDRERDSYRCACQMAHARRNPEPDREAHRARFYAAHDYHPNEGDAR